MCGCIVVEKLKVVDNKVNCLFSPPLARLSGYALTEAYGNVGYTLPSVIEVYHGRQYQSQSTDPVHDILSELSSS